MNTDKVLLKIFFGEQSDKHICTLWKEMSLDLPSDHAQGMFVEVAPLHPLHPTTAWHLYATVEHGYPKKEDDPPITLRVHMHANNWPAAKEHLCQRGWHENPN